MHAMLKYNVPVPGLKKTPNMFSYRKSKQISWTLNSMTAVGQHHLTLPTYSNIN